MTIEELKELINQSVQESIEDALEDLVALGSPAYLKSIELARQQYERGLVTPIDEIENV